MAVLSGFVYLDNGDALVGGLVNYYASTEAAPTVSLGNTTTNANGFWSFTALAAGRYDVRIDWDGTTHRRWRKGLSTDMVDEVTLTLLRLNNPALTFHYTVTPAAIVADRVLNLPLLAATDTVAVLAMAQTFLTGVKTFNSSILAIRNPADSFSYTLVAGAIAADRSLNLPLITGTDTLAVLGLVQTFTAVQTFDSPVVNTALTGTAVGTGASQVAQGSHVTPAMTATLAGHVPVPPNNTTTFLRGDGTFAAPAAGGALTRAGGNTVEASTTSNTTVDILTVSSLSIAVGVPVLVLFTHRMNTSGGGSADRVGGLTLNATLVAGDLAAKPVSTNASSGIGIIRFVYGVASYLRAGIIQVVGVDETTNTVSTATGGFDTAAMPTATLTTIIIRGARASGTGTLFVDEAHVYTHAVS